MTALFKKGLTKNVVTFGFDPQNPLYMFQKIFWKKLEKKFGREKYFFDLKFWTRILRHFFDLNF